MNPSMIFELLRSRLARVWRHLDRLELRLAVLDGNLAFLLLVLRWGDHALVHLLGPLHGASDFAIRRWAYGCTRGRRPVA